jgi:predicted RNase H-like HicB family nuclease|tara:strand:- start:68 stop:304 length:237 start_codon:yes stop_codon:yes gene_type:complete
MKKERIAKLHIEKQPEGTYLATSNDIQGLVAQGKTITETIEIAKDVAKTLLALQVERNQVAKLNDVEESFDYALVVYA